MSATRTKMDSPDDRHSRRTFEIYRTPFGTTDPGLPSFQKALGTKKAAACAGGSFLHRWATCLSSSNRRSGSIPADLDAGSATRGTVAGVTGGDHLDPECILVFEVRGVAGRAQRIQAALLRTGSCGGESRELED